MKGALKMTVKRARAGLTENTDDEAIHHQKEVLKAPEAKVQSEQARQPMTTLLHEALKCHQQQQQQHEAEKDMPEAAALFDQP